MSLLYCHGCDESIRKISIEKEIGIRKESKRVGSKMNKKGRAKIVSNDTNPVSDQIIYKWIVRGQIFC